MLPSLLGCSDYDYTTIMIIVFSQISSSVLAHSPAYDNCYDNHCQFYLGDTLAQWVPLPSHTSSVPGLILSSEYYVDGVLYALFPFLCPHAHLILTETFFFSTLTYCCKASKKKSEIRTAHCVWWVSAVNNCLYYNHVSTSLL